MCVAVSTLTHVYRKLITAPVDLRLLLPVNIQSTVMLILQCVSVCSSHIDKCVANRGPSILGRAIIILL